ncbi:flagellar export chaperone FliS [Schinkia azotoformans]|uniref:flagellar export chaperone FliS n=1 Tax=Schinkia azotoformans TaxID=1454 RepID=UPI002E20F245|nr:flagellar export chaperone FliS [Schinkia azotoformans]MED4350976.1 flagellar export chaperone FliS [Schinkia azotoformans]
MTGIFTEDALFKKSPQEITALLYEACLTNLEEAIDDINSKDLIIANKKLQKANDILNRLGAGLNYEAGIIADQLDALYNYMADKVVEANYKKDPRLIEEVIKSLEPIALAWNEALKKKPSQGPGGLRNKAMAYEKSVLIEDK